MAYVITIETLKPAGTLWYAQSGIEGAQELLQRIEAWDRARPGFVSLSGSRVSPDMFVGTITFDTKENGDQWLLDLDSNPDHVTRDAYLATLPIQRTITTKEE
jgi:hypothetical protein